MQKDLYISVKVFQKQGGDILSHKLQYHLRNRT